MSRSSPSACSPPWELKAFEELRNGVMQAYLRASEIGDRVLMACMKSHHSAANAAIKKLGGEVLPLADLETIVENAPTVPTAD